MLYYKRDILAELKKAGLNTTILRRDGVIGQSELTKIRRGVVCGVVLLDRLCALLHCQPGALIGWKPDPIQDPADHGPNDPGPVSS